MKRALLLWLCAAPALADPSAHATYGSERGAVLTIGALDAAGGFDFTLQSQSDCPEGETGCLAVSGHAAAAARGWTWAEAGSRIFFAATPEGVKVLQTLGDLGAGSANRAAKLDLPGTYLPLEPEAEGDLAAEAETRIIAFQSPTGNIGCQFVLGQDSAVRCDLMRYDNSFPDKPRDCDFDFGGAFWLSDWAETGEVICHSDTVIDPSAPVLDYGSTMTEGQITCWSEKSGLTCQNAAGHGFTLARKAQKVY